MNATMEEHKFPILNEMDWGGWNEQGTRAGPRMIRKTILERDELSERFWELWRENGGKLKGAGYSVFKESGSGIWYLCQWKMPTGDTTPQTEEFNGKEEEARKAENWVPEDVQIPDFIKDKLLVYQPDSVKRIVYALKKYGTALDGSDMGTGKTFTAIAAAMILDLNVAVICPLAVIPSWHRALRHFGVKAAMVINYESLRTGNTAYGSWTTVGKSEQFSFNLPKDTVICFDEIQKAKTASSQNCKMGLGALRQGFKILGMSGTIASNPTEMRLSGQLAKLHNGGDFYGWMKRNGVVKERFGFGFRGGQAVLHNIRRQIYPEHGTRLRKDDLPGFPECDIQAEAFDCGGNTKDIETVYDKMLGKLAEIESDGSKTSSERKACSLAEITAARMEAEKLKLPTIIEIAREYMEEGNSVVIFTNYRESLAMLSILMDTDCVVQGGQKVEVREKNINDFQEDKERVIIVNIQSGGAGISLHQTGSKNARVALICPSWSVFDMSQALGRIWRAGSNKKGLQKIIFAAGTIEEDVCTRVRGKVQNMNALNDGDLKPSKVAF